MFTAYETYRQILEAMPNSLYILDRNLVVGYTNPAMTSILVRLKQPTNIIGCKFTDVFHQTLPYLQDEIDQVYQSQQPLKTEHSVELGTISITYETVRIPLFDGNSGIMTGVLNTIHDITEYRTIQKDLQKSRQMFETMVDNANSIILRIDLEGRITYFNHFAESFFGFSRDQPVTVTMRKNNDTGFVEIVIADKGMGIEKEHLPFIFDPFFTTKRESGGTGLGLSISYGIIKDHKGTMEVVSTINEDTTFTITLPVYKD
jgi:signal transduction histidine kinase